MIKEILQFFFDALVQLVRKILDMNPNIVSIENKQEHNDSDMPAVVESASIEAAPIEAAPIEAAPIEAAPIEAALIEATPIEAPPIETPANEAATVVEPPPSEKQKLPDLPQDLTALKARCVNMKPNVLKLLSGKIQEELDNAKKHNDCARAQELRELSWKVTDMLCCGAKAVKNLETKTPWQQRQEKYQKRNQKKKKEWKQSSYLVEQEASYKGKRGRNRHGRSRLEGVSRTGYFQWTHQKFDVNDMINISQALVANVIESSIESLEQQTVANNYQHPRRRNRGGRRGNGRVFERTCVKNLDEVEENLEKEKKLTKIADDLVQNVLKAATANIESSRVEIAPANDENSIGNNKALMKTAMTFVDRVIAVSLERILKESLEIKRINSPTQAELLFDIVSTPTKDGICFDVTENRVVKIEKS